MKNETSLELLKLATQLACATISQNTRGTTTNLHIKGVGAVEAILKDCVETVRERFNDLTRTE